MKKILLLTLVLLMAFCSTPLAKDIADVKIGVSVGHLTEERWQREIEMFQNYANEHGFQLLVQSAEDIQETQINQCENLINQGVDVLIVQSLDASACSPIVDSAKDAGVPVIAYDRFIMNCDLDYYITFDTVKVGELQAKTVMDVIDEGNIIWLLGGPEDNNAHLLLEGQTNVLQPYIDAGKINVVLQQWCTNWDPEEALKNCENGLSLVENDIQGVVASNDGTAGGAIQALEAQQLAGIVPIGGQDADLAACQRIVEGTQTATVYKPLAMLNDACIQLAVGLAQGKNADECIDANLGVWTKLSNNFKDVDSFSVDVLLITKDNLKEILIDRDAFHSLEDVYANIPKEQWPS